jgi:hypothetical protein
MQPTYIPWAGYFSLISLSKHFFFLDDVQLVKQSWQTRNQINLSGQAFWMSVPVFHKKLDQLISETEIDDRTKWRSKHIKTIQMNYSKAPYLKQLGYLFEIIADKNIQKLSEFNIKIISETCKQLNLKTLMHVSSTFTEKSSDRSQRLIDLCKAVQCETYLSPAGAKEYLMKDGFLKNNEITAKIFNFNPFEYPQDKGPFISHLSFLDVVANISFEGFKKYISDQNSIKLELLC